MSLAEAPVNLAPAPSVSAIRIAGDPGRHWRIGVIGKRTWLVERGRCVLAPEQVPLVEEPVYDEVRAVLLHDADVMLNRSGADIVVEGHAYPPGGRTPFDFGIQVGAHTRLACGFGPRQVTQGPGGRLHFSKPAPIERIPLEWESAYGGVDHAARIDIGDPLEELRAEAGIAPDPRFGLFAYPRNPVGRGYVIEPTPEAMEACRLPLIEDARALLTPANLVRGDFVRWPQGPPVAAFGWLAHGYFPRGVWLGLPPLVYDGEHIPPAAFHEVASGELEAAALRPDRRFAQRLSVAAAQSAAIGMRAREVKAGDPVIAHGIHPQSTRWTFAIPSEVPRMAYRFAGERPVEMPRPEIRTVHLQPDRNQLTLVWVAEMALDVAPGPKRAAGLQHVVLWEQG
jgi:Uncharacterized protein conserved in bacteria (DUF2169)